MMGLTGRSMSPATRISEAEKTHTFPVDVLPGLLELGFVRGGLKEEDGGISLAKIAPKARVY